MAQKQAERKILFQIEQALEARKAPEYAAFRRYWSSLDSDSKALSVEIVCDALERPDQALAAELSRGAAFFAEKYMTLRMVGIEAHTKRCKADKIGIRNTLRAIAKNGRNESFNDPARLAHLFSSQEAPPSPVKIAEPKATQPAQAVHRRRGDIAPAGDPGRKVNAVSSAGDPHQLILVGKFSLDTSLGGGLRFTPESGITSQYLKAEIPATYALVVDDVVVKFGGSACDEGGILPTNIIKYCTPANTVVSRFWPREFLHWNIRNGRCAEYWACHLPEVAIKGLRAARLDFRPLELQWGQEFERRNGEFPVLNAKESGRYWKDITAAWQLAGWVCAARNSRTSDE
jgi:hypothetical protein